ncbi:hypothetical protein BaRGS_00029948, partial [Batillaria attramentaria]
INCTFDADGICGYQQLTNDNYDWFRGIGRTASIATGPPRDHTAELVNVARDKPVTANNRLSSAYHEMNAVDGDSQKCFTSDETEAAPYLFVDLLRKYPVVGVVLTNRHDCCPTRLTNYVIEVFDDIPTAPSATAKACATYAGPSSVKGEVVTVYCTQAVSGRYVKISKAAPSLQMCELEVLVMKPEGRYMFMETSWRCSGCTSSLTSPMFDPKSPYACVSFWYHMDGSSMGTLRVFSVPNWDVTNKKLLWSLSGDQGNEWYQAQVEVDTSVPVQILWEASRGPGYQSDIAIDDVSTAVGRCPALVCDFNSPGICGYEQLTTDDFNWTQKFGQTPSSNTGPSGPWPAVFKNAALNRRDVRASPPPSSVYQEKQATDGDSDKCYVSSTDTTPYLWVDVQLTYDIYGVTITNRKDCCPERMADYTVEVFQDEPLTSSVPGTVCGTYTGPSTVLGEVVTIMCSRPITGRYVKVSKPAMHLQICELEVLVPKTAADKYMYLETSWRDPGSTAELLSPLFTPSTAEFCLHFFYNMYGWGMGSLTVFSLPNGDPNNLVKLWSLSGNQGQGWKRVSLNVDGSTPVKILFKGVRGSSYTSDMAIDEVDVTPDACPAASCDFELPTICGYTQETVDDFDWTRHRGRTASSSTGPTGDHTTGTGYYMYFETSEFTSPPVNAGDRAVLVSPHITHNGVSCVTFWYNMYGSSMGTLNVYTQYGNNQRTVEFTRSGNQWQGWKKGTFEVDTGGAYKQLVFEGIDGSSYRGDMAIDDVLVVPGNCPVIGDVNCNFDSQDICGYTQDMTDDVDWTRRSGGTPSTNTGPSSDHTGGGHYMYVEMSWLPSGYTAIMISPTLGAPSARRRKRASDVCLTFWYNMYGSSMGTLNVYFAPDGDMNNKVMIWSMTGNQGQGWYEANIVFEGIRGNGYRSDIAVDDVSYVYGACPGPPPEVPPATTPAPTGPPPSVTPSLPCDFDTAGICGYEQLPSDDFNWSRRSGGTTSTSTGPRTDHGGQGHYMYTETSWVNAGLIADLLSPSHSTNSPKACLSFWYNMYGSTMGTLDVFLVPNGDLTSKVSLWSKSGNQGQIWKEVTATVDSSSPFK